MLVEIKSIMAAYGLITSGLKDTVALADAVKDAINRPNPDLIALKQEISSLGERLFEAKEAQMAVQYELIDLQQKLTKQDRFQTEAARYTLTQTDMGGRVYALKSSDKSGEPPHEICAGCFEKAEKSILQPKGRDNLHCYNCGADTPKTDGYGHGISVSIRDDPMRGY